MRKYFIPLMLLLMLDSCAMNTQFSCDATAGDKCLNVEEVDNLSKQGLTLENMPSNINPSQIASIPTEAPREAGMGPERIWIAPYTDAAGVAHEGSFVVINFPDTPDEATDDDDEDGALPPSNADAEEL